MPWQPGPEPTLDSATLWKRYEELMATGKPALTRTLGTDSKPAKTQAVEATYRAPYLAHAMEPMNCTAQVKQGNGKAGVEVWMPNQSSDLDAPGRRQDGRRVASPSHRAHDLSGRRLRPACRSRSRAPSRDLRAGRAGAAGPGPVVARGGHPPRLLPADGAGALAGRTRRNRRAPKLARVAKHQVAQSPTDQFPDRAIGLPARGKPEGNAVENPPDAFPFYQLDAVVTEGSVPVGFWRSVGHSHTAFFDESFIDELALALKKDPSSSAASCWQPCRGIARCLRPQPGKRARVSRWRQARAAALRSAPRSARLLRRSPKCRCRTARRCRSSASSVPSTGAR